MLNHKCSTDLYLSLWIADYLYEVAQKITSNEGFNNKKVGIYPTFLAKTQTLDSFDMEFTDIHLDDFYLRASNQVFSGY